MDTKVINKVRKILALKNNSAATQGEIENATALVQELLIKHNLTMDQISMDQEDYEEKILSPDQPKREGKLVPIVYHIIAKYHFCFVIIFSKYDNPKDRKHRSYHIHVIGKPKDIEVVEYLCEWLIPKIRLLANKSWNEYTGLEKEGKFKRGYYVGCAEGIASKLREERQRMAKENHNEITALVLKSDTKLNEAVMKKYPNLTNGRRLKLSSQDGRSSGYKDGRNLNLNKGIGSTKKRQIK